MTRTSNAMKIIEANTLAERQPGISRTSYDLAVKLHEDPKTVFIHMPGSAAETLMRQETECTPDPQPIIVPAPQFYVELRRAAQCVRSHFSAEPETGEPWGPEILSVAGMFAGGQLYEIDRELGAPRDTHVVPTFIHEHNIEDPGFELIEPGINPKVKPDEPFPRLNSLLLDLRDRSVYTRADPSSETASELLHDMTLSENRAPAPHIRVPVAQTIEENTWTTDAAPEFAMYASAICSHLASPNTIIIQEPMTRQQRRWMIQKKQTPTGT